MSRFTRILSVFVAALIIASTLLAAVPGIITYQGKLSESGSPVTGSRQLTIKLYNAAGSQVWSSGALTASCTNGLFSVQLGASGQPVLPSSIFSDTLLTVGIAIGAGSELAPRTRLSSVAFAYQALRSDTASLAKGIADNIVTSAKITNGTITFADLGQNGAATNQVIKWNGTAWVAANDSVSAGGGETYLPLAGGTMTGAISNTGDPEIRMGKGNFGSGNTNAGNWAFVSGQSNAASGNNSVVAGTADTALADFGAVLSGRYNWAGRSSLDSFAVVAGGDSNQATRLSFVGGGSLNSAEVRSVVGGGHRNRAWGWSGAVAGISDTAIGQCSFIGAGVYNVTGGIYASIVAGSYNRAHGEGSFVGGGVNNTTSGAHSVISGGNHNIASYIETFIGSGEYNVASGHSSAIVSGMANVVSAPNAIVGSGRSDSVRCQNGGILSGSYNIAGSGMHDTAAVVVGGDYNKALAAHSFVGGGRNNEAAGRRSVVAGGYANKATANWSTVCGGWGDTAAYEASTVAGGTLNVASEYAATISGGSNNRVTSLGGTIAGGGDNNASGGGYSAIGGGRDNTSSAFASVVAGGDHNTASGERSFVGSGYSCGASGGHSAIAGGRSNWAPALYAFVGGGYKNSVGLSSEDTSAVVAGGKDNCAWAKYSFVGGGLADSATGTWSVVAGGYGNRADAEKSAVGGGTFNYASGWGSTIGGGEQNRATNDESTVGGGHRDTVTSKWGTIGGGGYNYVSGEAAVVAGGAFNRASGSRATVPGGDGNAASGNYALAAGRRAKATHDGSFVWGDATDADVSSFANNSVTFRTSGGLRIYSNSAMTTGVQLNAGGGSWAVLSDRNVKVNLEPVDGQQILDRLDAMDITSWNYISQPDSVRHIGPMAQDFYAAFGVGEDSLHITSIDADGVALAAIKELAKENRDLKTQNSAFAHQAAALQRQIDDLRALVQQLIMKE